MDERMMPWAEAELLRASKALVEAQKRHELCADRYEQIHTGQVSIKTNRAFWCWAAMQPKSEK